MNNIALFNFIPKYCPNCGSKLLDYESAKTKYMGEGILSTLSYFNDYKEHASHVCSRCFIKYQLADTSHLLTAATASGGDLAQYVTGE